MRVLLVNGSRPAGGSFMSTHAFGRALVAGGHDVVGLVRSFEHPRRDLLHEQLVDASVKAGSVVGSGIGAIDTVLGRRSRTVAGHGYPVWSSPYPEHALPRLLRLFQPEVVVGNSIDRDSWRRCAALARRAGARTALHLREADAIGRPVRPDPGTDVVLADAASQTDLAGVAAFESALTSIGVGRKSSATAPARAGLGLSVVVPAHNARHTLADQLDALLAQHWAPGFEVIVADNLSTDGTSELVRRRMQTDERLQLVEATNGQGECFARNAGVEVAQADAIAFCDADDVVADGWVRAMGEALRLHALVAGKVEVEALNRPGVARSRGLAVAEGAGRFGPFRFAHGCNIGVQRAPLDAVGGWDDSIRIGPDIELCLRFWCHGVELHYEPSAEIHYRLRGTDSARWRQAVSYGAAHVDMARRLEVRQLGPPSRLHGARNLAWLVRHVTDLFDENRRAHWLWTAGLSAGHIVGSMRWRTAYL